MTLRALLLAYIVGGLTFIPLLIAAFVIPAWYLLPRAEQKGSAAQEQDVDTVEKERQEEKLASVRKLSGDAAASGTYAVLRRYDFQAALTALNGRQNSTTAAAGNSLGGDGLSAADTSITTPSESVYQSMYRSVLRNKNNSSTTSLLQDPDGDASPSSRKLPPANLLYIVLRHRHLMLYDSPAQVEVKHVLSLAHHKVTLQAGTHDEGQCEEINIPEADLFTKRTAIVLTPMELPSGTMQASAQTVVKPFYLFTATNIDKEDFYHALLSSRAHPPTPRFLESEALIKLQSSLHSSSLSTESRAIDALVGRLFLALHHAETLLGFVRAKLEKKLNRIQKPTFIPSLLVQSIDLGDAGPVFSNFRLRDLNIDGEMTLAADMKYNGGLSVTLLAIAKLDLGTRFKVRTVDLALKTVVQRISGTMLLRIKPPPSNRIWFCFENILELDVRVEPVVSERKITYGFVLRAIEERVRTAFKEGLVKPNWDDIPMPFSDTAGTHARGGLWTHHGEPDFIPASQSQSDNTLAERNAKSSSMPSLVPETFSTASTGVDVNTNITKVRHAMTMPPELAVERSPRPPRPLRTPSISSSPSTAVDGQNVEPVRGDDPSLRAQTARKLWRTRGSTDSPLQKDALAELRELQNRAEQLMNSTAAEVEVQPSSRLSLEESTDIASLTDAEEESLRTEESLDSASTQAAATHTPSMRSAASVSSTAASSESSMQSQSRKSNLLAATVNATTAAKNWSWNVIQRNRNGISRPERRQDGVAQQPIGRGMPLPPPGQPLPGPQKGIWGASLRRRPVPYSSTPEKPVGHDVLSEESTRAQVRHSTASSSEGILPAAEEEFQPWQENSGHWQPDANENSTRQTENTASSVRHGGIDDPVTAQPEMPSNQAATKAQAPHRDIVIEARKIPPPLPARRRQRRQSHTAEARDRPASSSSASVSSRDDIASAPALRIPEAEVTAVADEISTVQPHESPSSKPAKDWLREESLLPDPKAEKNAQLAAEGSQTSDFADAHGSHTGASSSAKAHETEGDIMIEKSCAIETSEPDLKREHINNSLPQSREVVYEASAAEDASINDDSHNDGNKDSNIGNDDEILSRIRARVKERTPAVENEDGSATQHKTSPSVGFSDGWPSH